VPDESSNKVSSRIRWLVDAIVVPIMIAVVIALIQRIR
jgi:hypothetical protein